MTARGAFWRTPVGGCVAGGVVALGLAVSPSAAQSRSGGDAPMSAARADAQDTAPAERPPYALDRSEEDWSALPGLGQGDPWDRVKTLPLGRDGSLTLAGEARSVYEAYDNYNWGVGAQDGNGYLLQRFMGSADARVSPRVRIFVEFRSALAEGRIGGPRPSQDRDTLDVSQLFVGWRLGRGARPPGLELKVGRQELNYGEGSLLAIRELNVRRTFDGVKAVARAGAWQVDLLAFRPARISTGVMDDGFDTSQALWGVWAMRRLAPRPFWTRVDLFYLGLGRDSARYQQGSASEQRHTLGVNLHARRGRMATFTEVDAQFGQFGAGRIRAWKYAQRVSWSWPLARLRPLLQVQGAVSSGDRDASSGDLQTFHPLFPKGLYYGRVDSSGSLNAIVVHPEITLALSPRVSINASHFSFWRQSTRDGLYSQPGFLLRSGAETHDRHVGGLQDVSVRWQVDRHTTVELTGAVYEPGDFLREGSAGRLMRYASVKWHYRF